MTIVSVSVAMKLILWTASFISNLVALFISLYLLISSYDLKENTIAPV